MRSIERFRQDSHRHFRWKSPIVRGVVGVLFALVGLLAGCSLLVHRPAPSLSASVDAEPIVGQMWRALNAAAWEQTGAVRWRMMAGRPLILWDRARSFAELQYGDTPSSGLRVLLDLTSRVAVAYEDDAPLSGDALGKATERAYADWANDSFWLAAPFKVRDPGTSRAIVATEAGRPAVWVAYASGGVTPGDGYLWHLDAEGRPASWQMWVQILPIGGLEVSWEEWTRLATGALIARRHEGPLGFGFRLDPLEGAADLADLTPSDPFAPLLQASRSK